MLQLKILQQKILQKKILQNKILQQKILQQNRKRAAAVLAAVLSVLLISGCRIHIWIEEAEGTPGLSIDWQEDSRPEGSQPEGGQPEGSQTEGGQTDGGSPETEVLAETETRAESETVTGGAAAGSSPEDPAEIVFSLASGEIRVPAYDRYVYTVVNGNHPFFSEEDMTAEAFESYSELDELGRCRTACACIGEELMPTEERGNISFIKPTGWQTTKYDFIEGELLYNRSHLIGYQLTAEDANERNLITGTRYLNAEGMEPFESRVAYYVKSTGNHVLYRVTPVFTGDNLIADGVLMEARSVEDEGAGVEFCVFVYNVQPGVEIDYRTGDNRLAQPTSEEEPLTVTYVLNTRSMKFHQPACDSVASISEHNRQDYTGAREDLIAQGYAPCQNCNP